MNKISKFLDEVYEEDCLKTEITKLIDKYKENDEMGHSYSSDIEKYIANYTKEKLLISNEFKFEKKEATRAHGDFKIVEKSTSREYLINVKSGEEKNGQPNICSLKRYIELIDGTGQYFLIKIKNKKSELMINVFNLKDLFENDCVSYDDGTGQLMLKESLVYSLLEKNKFKIDSITNNLLKEKIKNVYNLAYERHVSLRKKRHEELNLLLDKVGEKNERENP